MIFARWPLFASAVLASRLSGAGPTSVWPLVPPALLSFVADTALQQGAHGSFPRLAALAAGVAPSPSRLASRATAHLPPAQMHFSLPTRPSTLRAGSPSRFDSTSPCWVGACSRAPSARAAGGASSPPAALAAASPHPLSPTTAVLVPRRAGPTTSACGATSMPTWLAASRAWCRPSGCTHRVAPGALFAGWACASHLPPRPPSRRCPRQRPTTRAPAAAHLSGNPTRWHSYPPSCPPQCTALVEPGPHSRLGCCRALQPRGVLAWAFDASALRAQRPCSGGTEAFEGFGRLHSWPSAALASWGKAQFVGVSGTASSG